MKRFPYVPHPEEPTIFTQKKGEFSIEWPCWFKWKASKAFENGHSNFIVGRVEPYFEQITMQFGQQLLTFLGQDEDWGLEIPVEAKMMIEPQRHISQAWVLMVCITEKMEPHEAVTLAYALGRQEVNYKYGQQKF